MWSRRNKRRRGPQDIKSAASVLKRWLSGYYQTAAFQARDLLETAFLLDLLTADAALIAVWRADSNDAHFRRCASA
jgi:acyl CoA:acetate/3-ketoacid CoA transferase alpha subunit